MKLSTKLFGTVGATAAIGILAAGAGILYLRVMGEELRTATEKTAVKLDLVNAARARIWEAIASLHAASLYASLNNQAELDASEKRGKAAAKRVLEQIVEIRPLLEVEERSELDRLESTTHEFTDLSAEFVRFCRAKQTERLADFAPKVQSFAVSADEILTKLKNSQRALLKDARERSTALRSQSMLVNVLMGCLLIATAFLAVLVVRSIGRTLAAAIREISEGARQIAGAAGQVSRSSQSLAQGASQQAAALEETSASTEEIGSLALRNSEKSRGAAELVAESGQKFDETNLSLNQMVVSMREIAAHSEKISKIIKTIDEIAFQTNILALNAAVEAARAGEAGAGFSIVAEEVRNLSQRCAQAANDITALIAESVAKTGEGKVRVDRVAVAIQAITAQSGKVKILVDEVSSGGAEQARGTGEIAKAVVQMQQVTQTIAAQAEEGAAAAEELHAQSAAMAAVVRGLTRMLEGEPRSSPGPDASPANRRRPGTP